MKEMIPGLIPGLIHRMKQMIPGLIWRNLSLESNADDRSHLGSNPDDRSHLGSNPDDLNRLESNPDDDRSNPDDLNRMKETNPYVEKPQTAGHANERKLIAKRVNMSRNNAWMSKHSEKEPIRSKNRVALKPID